MDWAPASAFRWLFDVRRGAEDRLIPRWLFLRALGGIYLSAFFSLIFQIRGLIGPGGRKLPASGRAIGRSLARTMVCADGAVVLERASNAEWAVLGGYAGFTAADD